MDKPAPKITTPQKTLKPTIDPNHQPGRSATSKSFIIIIIKTTPHQLLQLPRFFFQLSVWLRLTEEAHTHKHTSIQAFPSPTVSIPFLSFLSFPSFPHSNSHAIKITIRPFQSNP